MSDDFVVEMKKSLANDSALVQREGDALLTKLVDSVRAETLRLDRAKSRADEEDRVADKIKTRLDNAEQQSAEPKDRADSIRDERRVLNARSKKVRDEQVVLNEYEAETKRLIAQHWPGNTEVRRRKNDAMNAAA